MKAIKNKFRKSSNQLPERRYTRNTRTRRNIENQATENYMNKKMIYWKSFEEILREK